MNSKVNFNSLNTNQFNLKRLLKSQKTPFRIVPKSP